ncbi:uncharacterized protein ACO6RY_18724 [Pungitius sinensis]
MEEEALQ